MERVYLRDGSEVILHGKTDMGYVIEHLEHYTDYEGNEETEPSGFKTIVDVVYKEAPVNVIEPTIEKLKAEENELRGKVSELKREQSILNHSISNLQRTQIENDKYIINRSDFLKAKSIFFFLDGSINPVTIDKNVRGIKITMDISILSGEERYWGYRIYEDYKDSSSNISKANNIYFDKSEEEILEISKQRVLDNIDKWSDNSIRTANDIYLTPELIERKKQLVIEERKKQLDRTLGAMNSAQIAYERELEKFNHLIAPTNESA